MFTHMIFTPKHLMTALIITLNGWIIYGVLKSVVCLQLVLIFSFKQTLRTFVDNICFNRFLSLSFRSLIDMHILVVVGKVLFTIECFPTSIDGTLIWLHIPMSIHMGL